MPSLRPTPWASAAMARLLWRLAALLALICAVTLLASGVLIENALRSAQREAFTARFELAAQRAAGVAENALALGGLLAPDTPLAGLLARESALEPALRSFGIVSEQGDLLLDAPMPDTVHSAPGGAVSSVPIRNDLGQAVAWVRLRYDDTGLRAAGQRLRHAIQLAIWPALALVCGAIALLCAALVARLRRRTAPPRWPGGERALLAGAAAVLLVAALTWMGWQAGRAGQASIQPDQMAKANALARSSAALIARALQVGVPADALAGLDAHVAALRERSPEIAALAWVTPDGRLLAGQLPEKGQPEVSTPVGLAGDPAAAPIGTVVLALDTGVLARQLRSMLLDMAFAGAICLLMALELLALGLGTRGARALAVADARRSRLAHAALHTPWRSASAAAVRPALFLFMLAEEFTRPFLPTWARTLAPADSALSPTLLASLPLVLFLAVVALLQWPLAAWSERFGRRPGFVLGALLGASGMALAAALPGYVALLAARLLGAVGFAMVFVSAQGAVIDGAGSRDRARSLAQFVRAILVAGLCGPPLGGMVAERWGVPVAWALAAAVALLAAAVARAQMPPRRTAAAIPGPVSGQPAAALLRQPGLVALLLGCALPAKLLLAALCFYLLPMHLQDQGQGSAVIGRLQTIYPLTMVLLVPLAARLADRRGGRGRFVVAGGLLAGASAMLAWPAGAAPAALALVLLGLGVGQALSITPQSALVADLARSLPPRQGAGVLGLFRLTERGGSALGPAAAALLLPAIGFGPALAAIGALVAGGSLLYGWSLRRAHGSAVR